MCIFHVKCNKVPLYLRSRKEREIIPSKTHSRINNFPLTDFIDIVFCTHLPKQSSAPIHLGISIQALTITGISHNKDGYITRILTPHHSEEYKPIWRNPYGANVGKVTGRAAKLKNPTSRVSN